MADKTTNFFINSAFSPSYDLTWSFQFSLCGNTGATGGFSTFLFDNNTLDSTAGKYTGLGFAPYAGTKGIAGAALGIMFDSTDIINIKTGTDFKTLTSFNLFKQIKPLVKYPSHVLNTIRFNLTDLGQTLNIAIKDKATDSYVDVLSIKTKLPVSNKTFYKVGFGLSSPLIAGDNPVQIKLSDIHTQGSLFAAETKISEKPEIPSTETFYIIQSPLEEKVLIGKPDPKSDGALLWSNGLNFNIMHDVVGDVLTIAGSTGGYLDDASALKAQFNSPCDIAVDSIGDMYVCDSGNHCIRKISTTNGVTTFAGDGTRGNSDGKGSVARFNNPNGIAIDILDNLYVADTTNHRICMITPDGEVTTLAGSTQGFANGNGTSAQFNTPLDLVVDSSQNVFVSDSENFKIRKITPLGDVTTFTGTSLGNTDGNKGIAKFGILMSLTLTPSGTMYATDKTNYSIRKISSSGAVSTIAGGVQGYADDNSVDAKFDYPYGLVTDYNGNIFISDLNNNKIRKLLTSGDVITVAGSTEGSNDGNKTDSQFFLPTGMCMDSIGSIYLADRANNKIRKIT